jgi:hypothetical protein
LITRDQAEDAVRKIGETDHRYAEAKTEVERSTWLCKHTRALVYEAVDGKNVEDRKQAVERHEKVSAAEERRINAVLAFESIKASRETKALIIEVWRSVEATRRRETIT